MRWAFAPVQRISPSSSTSSGRFNHFPLAQNLPALHGHGADAYLIAFGLLTALGAHLSPPLTLMEIPSQGLGETAAGLPLDLISCPQASPPPQLGVLRVWQSTRPGP